MPCCFLREHKNKKIDFSEVFNLLLHLKFVRDESGPRIYRGLHRRSFIETSRNIRCTLRDFDPPGESLLSLTMDIEKLGETEKRRRGNGLERGSRRQNLKEKERKRKKYGLYRGRGREERRKRKKDRLHNCKTVQAASVLSPISNLRQ